MAKDTEREQDDPTAARQPGKRGTAADPAPASASGGAAGDAAGGQHHAAKAHGRAARVDDTLPRTRPELMALHRLARQKRAAAPLGSDAYRAAADEIARIEVRIAAVDRAADPPLG
jgi:hypothetical protein